jgi:thioredoxin-dependent peroxiredoxin
MGLVAGDIAPDFSLPDADERPVDLMSYRGERVVLYFYPAALTFPLLSDPARHVLEAYGAWGEKKLYGKTVTGVIRSTVVVDPHGRIEHAAYNVKATGHVAKLMRDLSLSA